MNRQKILRQIVGVTIAIWVMTACGIPTPVPTQVPTESACQENPSAIQVPTPVLLKPDSPTWLPGKTQSPSEVKYISMVSSSTGWAVGTGGTILHLRDGVWIKESSPTQKDLISIDAISENEAYAVSKTGEVLAYDASKWTLLNSTSLVTVTNSEVRSAQFLSKTAGWAASGGSIFRFDGTGWQSEFKPDRSLYAVSRGEGYLLKMISPSEGWATGSYWHYADNTGALFQYKMGQWTFEPQDGPTIPMSAFDVNKAGEGWGLWKDMIYRLKGNKLLKRGENRDWSFSDVVTLEDGSGIAVGKPILLLTDDAITEWKDTPKAELQSLAYLRKDEAWAIDKSGNLLHYAAPGAIAPPGTPKLAETKNSGSYKFAVEWTKVDGATGYVLEQADKTGCSQVVYYGTETSANVAVRKTGDYLYRVKAVGLGGFGSWSQALNVTVREQAPPVRLVCNESGWKIEGEEGLTDSTSESTRAFDEKKGWVTYSKLTVTYKSGNTYVVNVQTWQTSGDNGLVTHRDATATGGVFGTQPETCTFQ